jgi:hypothetical protein
VEVGVGGEYGCVRPPTRMTELSLIYEALDSGWYCGLCWEPRRCVACHLFCVTLINVRTEIVMVRLQGDFAKPPEKRFNYKNCFDALFRVRLRLRLSMICVVTYIYIQTQMVREEGPSSLARGVGPNVFRAILMNASQLASCVLPLSFSVSFTLPHSRFLSLSGLLSFSCPHSLTLIYPFSPSRLLNGLTIGLLQIRLLQSRAAQDEVL